MKLFLKLSVDLQICSLKSLWALIITFTFFNYHRFTDKKQFQNTVMRVCIKPARLLSYEIAIAQKDTSLD